MPILRLSGPKRVYKARRERARGAILSLAAKTLL